MTLERLARGWARRVAAGDLLLAVAALVLVAAAIHGWGRPVSNFFLGAGLFVAVLLVVLSTLLLSLRWRTDEGAVARHLDRSCPELEESAELLLPGNRPHGVAELQRRRAERTLTALDGRRLLPWRPVTRGAAALLIALALAAPVSAVARWASRTRAAPVPPAGSAPTVEPAGSPSGATVVAPEIEVVVTPPDYTGLPAGRWSGLSIEAPEGSRVEWWIRVPGIEHAELRLEGTEPLTLERRGEAFFGSVTALSSLLYRLSLRGAQAEPFESPVARLAVIPDAPPEIEVLDPPRLLEAAPDDLPQLTLRARAWDDYGLGEAVLVSTLATGTGELVEFRERRVAFARRASIASDESGRAIELAVDLDTAALGLGPASELYLWVEVEDRRRPEPQSARSDTVIVRVPGERTAAMGLAEGLPAFQLPQFFRSQRQIILDTERLIAEAERLGERETGSRSESLGFDQRALRMRYAGLLGEEFVSGLAVGEEGEGAGAEALDHPGESAPGSARSALEALPEGFAHSHDSAEIATYFDDEVKAQLKAALAEMWEAEGALRGRQPGRALPFEYRALTLLKSAQAAERVYVQKVGFAPQPLDLSRRLTGALDEAAGTRRRAEGAEPPPGELGALLGRWIARMHGRPPEGDGPVAVDALSAEALAEAGRVRELVARAAAERGDAELLTAVDLLEGWISGAGAPEGPAVALLERVFLSLAPPVPATPARATRSDGPAFDLYLRNLAEGG
jgi:hypothetical protein